MLPFDNIARPPKSLPQGKSSSERPRDMLGCSKQNICSFWAKPQTAEREDSCCKRKFTILRTLGLGMEHRLSEGGVPEAASNPISENRLSSQSSAGGWAHPLMASTRLPTSDFDTAPPTLPVWRSTERKSNHLHPPSYWAWSPRSGYRMLDSLGHSVRWAASRSSPVRRVDRFCCSALIHFSQMTKIDLAKWKSTSYGG